MVDFLKANPFVTLEEYKWGLSVPMIRIMSIDNTRIHYLSDKQKKKRKADTINTAEDLMAEFGLSVDDINKITNNKPNNQ